MRKLFWIVLAVTLGIYATMLLWSLPKLTAEASGLLVFDLRPGGYSFEEAKAFLTALSPAGTEFYLNMQHVLDTLFPALSALSLGWAMVLLAPVKWGVWRFVIALVTIPGAVFDYLENFRVGQMLKATASGISEQMVADASFASQMKAGFVTLAMVVLLVMIVLWIVRKRRSLNQPDLAG